MKQKPRVKREAGVGSTAGLSHICSDSKADRLGEELRDAHTGLPVSKGREKRNALCPEVRGGGAWAPKPTYLVTSAIPNPSAHIVDETSVNKAFPDDGQ